MFMNNGNSTARDCGFGDKLVEYLYGEASGEVAGDVRRHLAGCGTCAAEAESFVSMRASIGEWKAEFDRIPTPPIRIPSPAAASVPGAPGSGIIESIRAFFASIPSLATAGGAVAVLAIAGLIAFFAIGRNTGDEVAGIKGNNATPSPTSRQATVQPTPPVSVTVPGDPAQPVVSDKTQTVRQPAAVKTDNRRIQPRQTPAGQRRPARNAPVLAEDSVEEDDGIRLADLFDEIGTED
jgi:anti-sigma factor RsiW